MPPSVTASADDLCQLLEEDLDLTGIGQRVRGGRGVQPEADRNAGTIRFQLGRCRSYMTVLDQALAKNAFVAGDELSLADIPVGALMYRYANLDVTDGLLPNVARWYDALTQGEAFREHVMLPFDDLKGRLAP